MAVYAKAITAFFTSLGVWGGTAFADGKLDPVEWFGLCAVVVATMAVYQIPNTAPRKRDARGRFTE